MPLQKSIGQLLQDLSVRSVGTFPFFDIIDVLPAAIYTTDAEGRIDLYNKAAVELWGREPDREDERWCGSWKLYYSDGRPMAHDACPMAEALKTGKSIRGREAIAERPDGTRVNFIPYPTPIKDEAGNVVGAINMLVDITERKKSELALVKSEARLRDFVETTTIGLHWVGPDGKVIWANRAEMDMLGYTAAEYIGQPIAKFHADEHAITDILERLARFETLRDYEARLRCKDGSIRHVLIDSSVYVEDGEFIHTRCFSKDVTSQKFAEQRLATSAKISQILSESDSLAQAFEAVLETLCEYFDADVGEIWLGEEALDCTSFYSRTKVPQLEKFKSVAMELKLTKGEGLPGYIWQTREPVWLEDIHNDTPFVRTGPGRELGLESGFGLPIFSRGQCRGAIVLFSRESVKSDKSLLVMMSSIGHKLGQFVDRVEQQEMNEHLASVIEASHDAVASADLDGIIRSWNKGAERLFGYTAEEAIGSPVTLILPKRALAARNRRIDRIKNGETTEPYETTRLTKSGETIHVSIGYSPVRDSRGHLVAVAAIARDITKRKVAEMQLKARIQQLQAISEIGIAALTSDKLENVFNLAVTHLAKGLGVEYTKVLELQPDGDLLLTSGTGWRKGHVGKATVGGDTNSQAGYTLSFSRPVLVEDLNRETRFSGSSLLVEHKVTSGLSTVIRGENTRPFGVLGAHTKKKRRFSTHDVHFLQSVANILTTAIQRKNYEKEQEMLHRELAHRVKNNMTVVQAIARMAAQFTESKEQFIESFEGRLTALAQSHDVLIASNWTGAKLGKLHSLVLGTQDMKKRIKLDLEDIKLDAEATQAIAMVIYELMTNASKYGALSNSKGTISVTGKRGREDDKPVYHYTWRETGGPPVSKPDHRGYGTKLIWWTVVRKCGGKVDPVWDERGLSVKITLPLSAIS